MKTSVLVAILLLSFLGGSFSKDGFQRTSNVNEKTNVDSLTIAGIFPQNEDNDENTASRFSEFPKVTDQYVLTPGTTHTNADVMKMATSLHKTYEMDGRPSTTVLPIRKEDITLESTFVKLGRRKRNATASTHIEQYCEGIPFWKTSVFFLAVTGWTLFVIVGACFTHMMCKKCHEFKKWKFIEHDIEAGERFTQQGRDDKENEPGMISITHNELKLYHDLSERRQIIKHATSEAEYMELSSGMIYEVNVAIEGKKREDRRAAERRAVIRRHSSMIRRPSLLDEIQFAREVIMDDASYQNLERKRLENRKLIQRKSSADIGRFSEDTLSYAASILYQERQRHKMSSEETRSYKEDSTMSIERSGSPWRLDEDLSDRSAVIEPSRRVREFDEDAAFRRQFVASHQHGVAGHRMSFTDDDIIMNYDVITPERRSRGESFESRSDQYLSNVGVKASGSWYSI